MNSIDFGVHRSKVKVTMVIIDKCGAHGEACLALHYYISSFDIYDGRRYYHDYEERIKPIDCGGQRSRSQRTYIFISL